MRDLATDRYTAAQVAAQLRSSACRYVARFELLDASLSVVGDLTGLVTKAKVTVDTRRPIIGALDLEMLPDDDLASAPFQYRVKPWFGVRMPDGNVAEYPQGVYVWTFPDRAVGDSEEVWKVTLGDMGHELDASGPGTVAFPLNPGDRIDTAIRRLFRWQGWSEAGVVASSEKCIQLLSWGIKRNRQWVWGSPVNDSTRPETWLTVARDLTDMLSYNPTWFDADGLPIAEPAANLTSTDPGVIYETARDGIMLDPVQEKHDLDELANRVYVRSETTTDNWMRAGVADANRVVPTHPLAQRQIGFFIDAVRDDPGNVGHEALNRRARTELLRRLASVQTLTTPSLAWPVHEPFDVVGVRYDGDRALSDLALFDEHGYSLTLVGRGQGEMVHTLSRRYPIEDEDDA